MDRITRNLQTEISAQFLLFQASLPPHLGSPLISTDRPPLRSTDAYPMRDLLWALYLSLDTKKDAF